MSGVRLGVVAVASPLEVGAGDAPDLAKRLYDAFSQKRFRGLKMILPPHPVTDPASAVAAGKAFYDARVDAVCAIAASWFEDYLVMDLLEECPAPLIAWARPGMETGSLCGMQQLVFVLRQSRHPHCFVFEPVGDDRGILRAWDMLSAAALRNRMRRARIGYLGHRVEGMTETTAHELALKKVLGPRVVGMDSQAFLQQVNAESADLAASEWGHLASKVGTVTASEASGIESLRVYAALKRAIVELGLSAIAVGCYPHLMGKVCLAASLLAEEGVPVACEGDVNGALGMLMLTQLTGQPVHNADLLDPIPDGNTIVFSHCGSGGFSLATSQEKIALAPVRLMDQGLCCLFPGRPGQVTLLNIVPALDGYRLGILYGEAIETDMVFPGNPLRVRFDEDYRDVLSWMVAEGLGHHWMIGYGDLRQPLRDLGGVVGCDCVSM